jgi:hypothetical protein
MKYMQEIQHVQAIFWGTGQYYKTTKNVIDSSNSVAWVRERTTPTERPPFVDEVSASF